MSLDTDNTDFTPPTIEEISALLPSYEIVSFIAKGGMGAVYKATQKSLDRTVAIKILPRHFGEDAEFRTSFEAEAKSMAKLNHPNLIGIYDFGQVDGLLYIIMEMVEGQSLYEASYGKKIEPADAAEVIFEICMGLDNAHKQGILHRDIKPANILLDASSSPKIGDFGLARPVGEHELDSAFGTPGYTAPEVIYNPRAVDESTDLYAVGVMLYELITTNLPAEHYISVTHSVNANPKFDQIIRKAINPIPSERYSNAKEMAEALKPLASKKGAASPFAQTNNSAATRKPINPYAANMKKNKGNSFLRNIIIIAILLGGIYISWERYKKVKLDRAAKAEKIELTKKQAKAEREAKAEKKRQELQEKARIAKLKAKERLALLRKRQTLEYLQPSLLNGARNKFPYGSVEKGKTVRFFVDKKMTWLDAQNFCQEYAGHLAIITDTEEQDWLAKKITSPDPIWIGAGTTGRKQWGWIDGSPFNLEIRNTTKASYVTIDSTGFLNPESGEKKLSFFIEWNKEENTQTSLQEQLKRCGASIKSKKPKFPAGTINYDGNHYLIVSKNVTWLEAKKLAEEAGGFLASTNNSLKNEALTLEMSLILKGQKGCWIGAYKRSDASWQWLSGQSWDFTKWASNEPSSNNKESAVGYINSQSTWAHLTENDKLPFFMIEWNKKARSNMKKKRDATAAEWKRLRKICRIKINEIYSSHKSKFKGNTSAYHMELNSYLRGLTHSEQTNASTLTNDLISLSKDNHIPPVDEYENPINEKVQKIIDYRLKKQLLLEQDRSKDVEKLRLGYHKEIYKLIAKYNSQGLHKKANFLKKEIELTDNTENFYEKIIHDSQSE